MQEKPHPTSDQILEIAEKEAYYKQLQELRKLRDEEGGKAQAGPGEEGEVSSGGAEDRPGSPDEGQAYSEDAEGEGPAEWEADSLDHDHRQRIARALVLDWVRSNFIAEYDDNDVYIVWFSKVLQNWKALVSTNIEDGRYYEVTFDGEKGCAYFDVYLKTHNIVVQFRED